MGLFGKWFVSRKKYDAEVARLKLEQAERLSRLYDDWSGSLELVQYYSDEVARLEGEVEELIVDRDSGNRVVGVLLGEIAVLRGVVSVE